MDVGGTNTNVSVAGVRMEKPELLFSLNYKSNALNSLIPALNQTLDYARVEHNIVVGRACIGAAGHVLLDHGFCETTNLKWNIRAKDILRHTPLKSVFILNDFEAVGYGVNALDVNNKNNFWIIRHRPHKHTSKAKATKAIVGAGTGLGKNILVYEDAYGSYVPIPSEGGHGDFPMYDKSELSLGTSIKSGRRIRGPVSYEEVLSGRGIDAIYSFIRKTRGYKPTKYTREIGKSRDKVPLIAKYKVCDRACKETFRLYARFYARCAKNFVLDSLCEGGLYIAGGIASKNPEIFKGREFIKEFENSHHQKQILRDTPIYVIKNYDISLYGTCFAAIRRHDIALNEVR